MAPNAATAKGVAIVVVVAVAGVIAVVAPAWLGLTFCAICAWVF